MTFYHDCLQTELQLAPFMDEKPQPSVHPKARIMHAELLENNLAARRQGRQY